MTSKKNKGSAREKPADERQRQAAADRRRRATINSVIAVVVVAVIVVVFVIVQNSRTSSDETAAVLPELVSAPAEGMRFGDGPVIVDLWEDFQCPSCKAFEAAHAELLAQQVDDGAITLVIHPLSFLDTNLSNTSSSLAANAFGCSAAAGESAALDFHALLFEKQPPEDPGTEAWSVDDLVGWGGDVGIEGADWSSCVNDGTYAGWVDQVAKSQVDAGVTATPTIFINDERFDLTSDLAAALKSAGQES